MVQTLFIDLEQRIEDYEFTGNYEIIGEPLCGDVLSDEIELLNEAAILLGVTPLDDFVDKSTKEAEAPVSLDDKWFLPQEGLATLNALLLFLKKRWPSSVPVNRPFARKIRRLLATPGHLELIDELETMREYIAQTAALAPQARFRLFIVVMTSQT